jgi:hypothetical protein
MSGKLFEHDVRALLRRLDKAEAAIREQKPLSALGMIEMARDLVLSACVGPVEVEAPESAGTLTTAAEAS